MLVVEPEAVPVAAAAEVVVGDWLQMSTAACHMFVTTICKIQVFWKTRFCVRVTEVSVR